MKRIVLRLGVALVVVLCLAFAVMSVSAETAQKPGFSGNVIHVVQWGDTVASIADRYGTSPILIINANHLRNPSQIRVGQRLVVPVKNYVSPGYSPAPAPAPVYNPPPVDGGCIPYTIQAGDSVASIAARFGVSQASLIQINNLINPNYIHAGVTIRVCNVVSAPPPVVVYQPVPQIVQPVVIVAPPPVIVAPPPVIAPPPPKPPACNTRYEVGRGDTLFGIAQYYGTTVQAIRNANGLPNDYLYVGQVLWVPCGDYYRPPVHRPEPKPKPPAPSLSPAVCNPAVSISYPRQNETVGGIINIVGTARIPNFQFYKVEYGQGEVPFNWVSIGETVNVQRTGTTLATWDTGSVPPGVYQLRLTAVENTGQFPEPCTVRIIVDP